MNLSSIKNKYLYLCADCFCVKGYTRTMICDISRHKMYFISNSYYLLLIELKNHTLGDVMLMLSHETDYSNFIKFIDYLIKNELGFIVDDLSNFPPIKLEWDNPSIITNAIIDIRDDFSYIKKAFTELEELNCHFIQVRIYKAIPIKIVMKIISYIQDKSIRSIQIFLKYDVNWTKEDILKEIIKKYPYVYFIIHSSPWDNFIKNKYPVAIAYTSFITYIRQEIQSCEACGIINRQSFFIPSLQTFVENIKFNGCLNRKISVDEFGEIKNCPSMTKSYGNIKSTSFKNALKDDEFKKLWFINKDSIEICKDCEFRYVCTDCRAYVENGKNIYSKPLKCKYDPYTGKWNN